MQTIRAVASSRHHWWQQYLKQAKEGPDLSAQGPSVQVAEHVAEKSAGILACLQQLLRRQDTDEDVPVADSLQLGSVRAYFEGSCTVMSDVNPLVGLAMTHESAAAYTATPHSFDLETTSRFSPLGPFHLLWECRCC
jgi:hypothetical protein